MGLIFGALPQWAEGFSGDGSGSGSGSGDGDGDGDGYGDGSGSGYWRLIAARFASLWGKAEGFVAFWKSTKGGCSANGGKAIEPAAPGVIHAVCGPLKLCGSGALHATLNPDRWQGDRLWIVALKGEVAFADDKVGALERKILCEVTD